MFSYHSSKEEFINSELEVISCGVNVPFADKEILFGSIMGHRMAMTDETIFNDISNKIRAVIKKYIIKTNRRRVLVKVH